MLSILYPLKVEVEEREKQMIKGLSFKVAKEAAGAGLMFVLLLLLLILSIIVIPNAGAVGVGVVPANVSITDATRGGEYEQVINVYNTDTTTSTFRVYATGDIRSWISFYDLQGNRLTEMTIPGKNRTKILMKFRIPEDAPTGSYKSMVYVESIPGKTATKGAAAQVGIQVPVEINLRVTGEQILSGIVHGITISDTEEGYPLIIRVLFRNTGNVIAKPVINVEIFKGTTQISSFSASNETVKPHRLKEIRLKWDTEGQAVGDYLANVSVSLAGKLLNSSEIPFKILEPGTLTRNGILRMLSYEGKPEVGALIKVLATFENTGKISTKARFYGEVYRNGQLIDVINSEELEVPVRETGVLTSYLKLDAPGAYNISGYVLYEGKKTDKRSIQLEVGSPKRHFPLPAIGAAGTLIAIILTLIIFKINGVRFHNR